jgi:hypothetical protein
MSFHISFEFQHLCRCKEQNGWRWFVMLS